MQIQQQVYIVDGDPRVVTHLSRPLSLTGCRVTYARSTQEFLAGVSLDVNSCALLDLDLPDQDGFVVLEQLQRRKLAIPTIFITQRANIATCVRAMRAGVVDFLIKPAGHAELLDAIARALAIGMHWHTARADEILARELLARLTIRERQVLELVLAGLRNKEIATALASQEATVKVHRSRMMRKLGARSLVELVRFSRYLVAPLPTTPDPRRSASQQLASLGAGSTGISEGSDGNPYLGHCSAAEPAARNLPGSAWADAAGTWSDFSWTTRANAETAS